MKTIFAFWFSALLVVISAHGQEVPPAFERGGNAETGDAGYDPFDPAIDAPKMIRVQVELVEMSHKDLTRLLMEDKAKTADATALRMKVQALVNEDTAKVIDTQIVTGRSGQKSTTDSLHEFIYPTEYEPLDMEKMMEKFPGIPFNPAHPTAFETRNLGSKLESEPTLAEDEKIIDLRLQSEFLWHTGNTVWSERKDADGNVFKTSMPDFYLIRISTSVVCITGQYVLAGVLSPKDAKGAVDHDRKIMVFAKCNVLPAIP